jgi:hypothetical protein
VEEEEEVGGANDENEDDDSPIRWNAWGRFRVNVLLAEDLVKKPLPPLKLDVGAAGWNDG